MPPTSVPRPGRNRALDAYLAVPTTGSARPPGDGERWPGVVIVHEIVGLGSDIRRHADRLAGEGYLALAPNLYTDGGMLRCLRATFRALGSGRGPAVDDILASRDWLGNRADCTGRIGIIGFCMGGGFALLLADRGFDASAPNYGPMPAEADAVLAGACPIVASYGARDRIFGTVPGTLEPLLAQHGVDHDVRLYPEAGHSFLNQHRTGPLGPLLRVAGVGYHEPSATDAWTRILRFFDRHLRPAGDHQ